MNGKEKLTIGFSILVMLVSGILHYTHANTLLVFVFVTIALALTAKIVGDATEQLGKRMGPGVTGVLQSALGNLPELFVCIFALRAGLDKVVQAALVGSILGNSLLVLGFALFVGGWKNGTQHFRSEHPRMIVTLMVLAVAAIAIPTLTKVLNTAANIHLNSLDIFVAIVLLCLFVASLFYFTKGEKTVDSSGHDGESHEASWSLALTLSVLALASISAGFVSEWFVAALEPAMGMLGINDFFAGLVIVAIAGNAIEHFVGVQLAFRNKPDYALSVILNSSLQIALCLFPVLVLLSFVMGGIVLSFVLSPLLLAAMALTVVVNAFVVFDGESIWLEGLSLIGLYLLIAAAFWWG